VAWLVWSFGGDFGDGGASGFPVDDSLVAAKVATRACTAMLLAARG
jgi:hypothetical protein